MATGKKSGSVDISSAPTSSKDGESEKQHNRGSTSRGRRLSRTRRRPSGEKPKVHMHFVPKMLDYSFFQYKNFESILPEQPRLNRYPKLPPKVDDKFITSIVTFSNNELTSLSGIYTFIETNIHHGVNAITWIDISHNSIPQINEELLSCVNLSILYLNHNTIKRWDEVLKLNQLEKLKILTLNGNPLCALADYRIIILYLLPNIRTFDFQLVTRRDLVLSYSFGKLAYIRRDDIKAF